MRPFPAAVYILALFIFTLLAINAGFGAQRLDRVLLDVFRGLQSAPLDVPMRAVEFIGDTWPSIILPGMAAVWFWVKGYRREALWLVTALATVALAGAVVKGVVDRTRPDGGYFSFTSGHTGYFTVFCGFLFFRLKSIVSDQRWFTAWRWGLVMPAVLTGVSRLYFGVHWPTDVLGGFLLGVIVLVPVLWRLDYDDGTAT
ncbi:phosphatase PAP2 family protein [Dehalogenimonas sp. THU2]|uniref:phosphatase PAP2 family protein n=1 Tax=Dehalogenimonas sp. THU2 TaxID=3151121 RepID=UPI0032182C37